MQHSAESAKSHEKHAPGAHSHSQTAVPAAMHPVLQLQRQAGNDAVSRLIGSGMIMRAASGKACSCAGSHEPCDECGHSLPPVSREASGPAPAAVPSSVPAALQSASRPLDASAREYFEPRFGHDFSGVQVHTGAEAAKSARAINAVAYTAGDHMVFDDSRYSPDSEEGRQLLAHELSHVVQQRGWGGRGVAAKSRISHPDDPFEREADHAAAAVMRGQRPSLSASGLTIHRKGSAASACADGGAFIIPPQKGPDPSVVTKYEEMAKKGELYTRSDERSDDTSRLQKLWREKKKVPAGKPLPKDNEGNTCTVDHIVESILHGKGGASAEYKENMQLMGGKRNSSAGAAVRKELEDVRRDKGLGKGACVRFDKAEITNPMPPDECMLIDENVDKWLAAGKDAFILMVSKTVVPLDLSKADKSEDGPGVTLYTCKESFLMRAGTRKSKTVRGVSVQSVQLSLDGAGKLVKDGKADGVISKDAAFPFLAPDPQKTPLRVDQNTHKLEMPADPVKFPVKFPGLSETTFSLSTDEAGELQGDAELHPSKPILKKAVIQLHLHGEELSAKVQIPAKELSIPVPGLTLSGDGLTIGFENDALFASGQIIFDYGTAVHGELNAAAKDGHLTADGKLDLTIPGLDRARGEIWLDENANVGGSVEVAADKLKIPGAKSASLKVTIQEGRLSGSGTVEMSVPGIKSGTLDFGIDKAGEYSITGAAALEIPGLKATTVSLTYAGGDLTGEAKTGLDIPGLQGATGDLSVRYAKGALTGSGAFSYKKGKLSGSLKASLSEKHKLSGTGEFGVEISQGLTATLGVELREDGTAKFSGNLKFPDPINLFDEKKVDKTIFDQSVQIPLFAIPLGTRSVGLVADIGASLKANAGIGPGQLRKLNVAASYDPSNENSKFEFKGGGELYVPAHAEIALAIHGGVGLSLAIASATGGIELSAAMGLRGALQAVVQFQYIENKLSVDAAADLSAEPYLNFKISSYVKVDVWLIGEVFRKDWNLLDKTWGSGLKIGLHFPVHYEFGKPFNIALDQVQFIVPDIDYKKAVKDLLPT